MSISLAPISDPDGNNGLDMDVHTWRELCEASGASWDGTNDPQTYSPEELEKMARVIRNISPQRSYFKGWVASLEWLASQGGAILS